MVGGKNDWLDALSEVGDPSGAGETDLIDVLSEVQVSRSTGGTDRLHAWSEIEDDMFVRSAGVLEGRGTGHGEATKEAGKFVPSNQSCSI